MKYSMCIVYWGMLISYISTFTTANVLKPINSPFRKSYILDNHPFLAHCSIIIKFNILDFENYKCLVTYVCLVFMVSNGLDLPSLSWFIQKYNTKINTRTPIRQECVNARWKTEFGQKAVSAG